MADPQTVNVGLAVPLRGSNVGTWDTPVNADFASIDGMFAGIANIAVASTPVTLTSPTGFTPTPGPGPVQSQNAVLQFSGVLAANVTVTLPTPGVYVIENNTTGAFLLTFRAVNSGEVIATPQGSRMRVYCDGTNVRFANLGWPGKLVFEGGEIGLPAWMAACTKPPFLLCDGTVYNIADYPALGAKYGNKFGGNGATTFGVQDLRGRVPLAYDGTGTRITVALCGIDGQVLGASGGLSGAAISKAQLPAIAPAFTGTPGTINVNSTQGFAIWNGGSTTPGGGFGFNTVFQGNVVVNSTGSYTPGGTIANLGSGDVRPNQNPSQVSGVWLVKT